MLLETMWPNLPSGPLEIAIFLCALLGTIIMVYSQFIESENRREIVTMLGSLSLLVYAVSVLNLVFIIAFLLMFSAALIKFVEIYAGIHKHTKEQIKEYKKVGRK